MEDWLYCKQKEIGVEQHSKEIEKKRKALTTVFIEISFLFFDYTVEKQILVFRPTSSFGDAWVILSVSYLVGHT